jgi:hypothetical protein
MLLFLQLLALVKFLPCIQFLYTSQMLFATSLDFHKEALRIHSVLCCLSSAQPQSATTELFALLKRLLLSSENILRMVIGIENYLRIDDYVEL